MGHVEFELTSVIPVLRSKKETKPLAEKLKRLLALFSIQHDLRQTIRALGWLTAEASVRRSDSNQIVKLTDEQAMFDTSLGIYIVINYARCTENSSARSRFDPFPFYSEEEKCWHREIIQHRNQAVAHFGPGSHVAGPWVNDVLRFMVRPATSEINFGIRYERANFKSIVLQHLGTLLPKALEGIGKDIEAAKAKVIAEISAHEPAWLAAISLVQPSQPGGPWDGWLSESQLGPPGFSPNDPAQGNRRP